MLIKCTLCKCKNKLQLSYFIKKYYHASVVSCCSNFGYFSSTSNHVSLPLDKSFITSDISSNCNSDNNNFFLTLRSYPYIFLNIYSHLF